MPSRRVPLEVTVNSILPQVDRLFVYLNNFRTTPGYLNHEKITVYKSQDYGDYGDSGKFAKIADLEGYYFSIDDDIVYHNNYIQSLINKIEQYNRKCVVGLHGVILKFPVRYYYRNRNVIQCKRENNADTRVHILGTGALGFHTDTIKLSVSDFEINNMADIWFGIQAQKQKVGMICIERANPLMTIQDLDFNDSIFTKCRDDSNKNIIYIRAINSIKWRIYE